MTITKPTTIDAYNAALPDEERLIAEELRAIIDRTLPDAESRIWHAHPVWFLDGNPIVGYSRLKTCMRLLFWSGQSFDTPGLTPGGTFKAAEARYTARNQINPNALVSWLDESRAVQRDYKNIVKRKGRLERL